MKSQKQSYLGKVASEYKIDKNVKSYLIKTQKSLDREVSHLEVSSFAHQPRLFNKSKINIRKKKEDTPKLDRIDSEINIVSTDQFNSIINKCENPTEKPK